MLVYRRLSLDKSPFRAVPLPARSHRTVVPVDLVNAKGRLVGVSVNPGVGCSTLPQTSSLDSGLMRVCYQPHVGPMRKQEVLKGLEPSRPMVAD